MPSYDFRTPRLFVDAPLAPGGTVPLDRMQTNYLCNVLRMAQGAPVLVFNGREGEWLGALDRGTKKSAALVIREQDPRPDARRTICIICSRRSNMRGSTTWCRKRSSSASRTCSR